MQCGADAAAEQDQVQEALFGPPRRARSRQGGALRLRGRRRADVGGRRLPGRVHVRRGERRRVWLGGARARDVRLQAEAAAVKHSLN